MTPKSLQIFTPYLRYDTADRIPDGSIQRAGENILALIKEIANSDLLADPGEDRHGKVVYYDVLGLFVVQYPERLGLILNYGTLVLGLVGLWFSGKRRRGESKLLLIIVIFTSKWVTISH